MVKKSKSKTSTNNFFNLTKNNLTKWIPTKLEKITPIHIGIIVLILILLLRYNNPTLFNNLLSMIILTLVFNTILNDWKRSVLYAAVTVIILSVIQSILGVREYFDTTYVDLGVTGATGITGMTGGGETGMILNNNNGSLLAMSGKTQIMGQAPTTNDDNVTTYDQWTDTDKQTLNNRLDTTNQETANNNGNSNGSVNPVQAQRETYRLIDTLKQLQTTVDNMTPTIKAGQKIIQAFDNMGLGNLKQK